MKSKDDLLFELAQGHFHVEVWEDRNLDSDDFYSVSIASIRSALEDAFNVGKHEAIRTELTETIVETRLEKFEKLIEDNEKLMTSPGEDSSAFFQGGGFQRLIAEKKKLECEGKRDLLQDILGELDFIRIEMGLVEEEDIEDGAAQDDD